MNILRSGTLTLEPQVAAHAAEMFRVLSDPMLYDFENAPPASERWLAERYARLEARQSADGAQQWLNWVVRLESGELCGYVQATIVASGSALVAYELGSRWWRRGIGSAAVRAMLDELASRHAVPMAVAVFKRANHRSLGLLRHLGFEPGSAAQRTQFAVDDDEDIRMKLLHGDAAAR